MFCVAIEIVHEWCHDDRNPTFSCINGNRTTTVEIEEPYNTNERAEQVYRMKQDSERDSPYSLTPSSPLRT